MNITREAVMNRLHGHELALRNSRRWLKEDFRKLETLVKSSGSSAQGEIDALNLNIKAIQNVADLLTAERNQRTLERKFRRF